MDNNCIDQIPVFYYDALNSQARSCYMLLKILKILVKIEEINFIYYENMSDMNNWLNNFYTAPTLVDCGVTLCHGQAIMMYLCEKYCNPMLGNLFPRDYVARLKIISLFFYDAYFLSKYLGHMLADIFVCKYDKFDTDYHGRKVEKAYSNLNNFLDGHTYMISNYFTIADITMISTVSAFHIIFPIDHQAYPHLFNWYHRLRNMSFYQHNEEGIFKLRYLLQMVGKFPFPSPYSNHKSQSVKSEEMRTEGGFDTEVQRKSRSRKRRSKLCTSTEKMTVPSEISITSSGRDMIQKSEMSDNILTTDVKQKGSHQCKCNLANAKVGRKLYDERVSEGYQPNYSDAPLESCIELDFDNSKPCEVPNFAYCPPLECIDYTGGLCNQPITYQINKGGQRLVHGFRHRDSIASGNCEGMTIYGFNNAPDMCWCDQTNQFQCFNDDCVNQKVITTDTEKKVCENILHGAVEKLKQQRREKENKSGRDSSTSTRKCKLGDNCSVTDASYPTYVWLPQTCRIQKSAACCNLVKESDCEAENSRCCKRNMRKGLQTVEGLQHSCRSLQSQKWGELSQKSIEICDLPPIGNQTENRKTCNCRQLQINCHCCNSNQDARYCNPNKCNGNSNSKTNTPVPQSSQCYSTSQCYESTAQSFSNQNDCNVNSCSASRVKKFPVIKGNPMGGKATRRFFILSSKSIEEKDETSPATVTEPSEENKKELRPKKGNKSADVKRKRHLNRLQAGSARPHENKKQLKKCMRARAFTDDDSMDTLTDDSEEVTKIIYHICMKDDLQYERKCKCSNCVKSEFRKSFKSKIPRLVPNYRRDLNSSPNVAHSNSEYEVLGKNYF